MPSSSQGEEVVYIRLQGLVLGNYRTMLSVGVASTNSNYANGNMEDRNTLEAVSYTHLDVYKRQLLEGLSPPRVWFLG